MARPLVRGFASACVLAFLPSLSSAQTVWIDGRGDWFDSSNWSAGVPHPEQDAEINNGGEAQVQNGGATGRLVTLGRAAGEAGTLAVTGQGTLTLTGNRVARSAALVGGAGSGVLNITRGGVLMTDFTAIAAGNGSTGVANVDGAGSQLLTRGDLTSPGNSGSVAVGNSGNGTLNVTNGGFVSGGFGSVGDSFGSSGTARVDGTGSVWSSRLRLTVGGSGDGSLTITNGGYVSNDAAQLGSRGTSGTVSVIGAGSTWMNSSFIAVGASCCGESRVNIREGGTVTSAIGTIGEHGRSSA